MSDYPIDPELMWSYMMGEDPYSDLTAPLFDEGQMGGVYGIVPTTDLEGDPLSASTQSSIFNRWRTSLFDPMFAGMGGGQAFAPGAFDPTIGYEMVDSPALTALNMYRRNPQGSIEGMVLEELEKGGTPATAFAHLRNLAAQETPLGDMVRSQLLPATMPDGGVVEGEYDWRDVMGRIATVQQQMTEAPQLGPVGAVYNEEGNLIQQGGENVTMYDEAGNPIVVRQTTTPSPLGEKYAELGLTPPGVEYQVSDFTTPEMEQAMSDYAAMGPAVDAAREAFLAREEPPPMGVDRLRGQYQAAAQPGEGEQGEGGGGGLPGTVGGWNIPWAGRGGPNPAVPGVPGAVGSMATLRESIPWAVDVTANQMVPGLPLNTDAASAVLEAGAGNDVLRNATTAANNPAGTLWGGLQSGWNWLFPGQEEEAAPAGGGGGTRPQVRGGPAGVGEFGAKSPPALTSAILRYLQTGEEAPPSGTIPNYTEPEPAPPPAAQPAAPYEPSREYPPSASEIPQAPAPPPPHPASMWPPTLLYDPWAPAQATAETMQTNLGIPPPGAADDFYSNILNVLGQPAQPAFVGAGNPMASPLADLRSQRNIPAAPSMEQATNTWNQLFGIEPEQQPFQPPQPDWLGINWGGQEPPPAPGPLPEPREERTRMQQPTQFNVQLPPGAAPGPTAPPPLMGTPPPADQLEPGHYRVTLPGTQAPGEEPSPQRRPVRHPEAPLGGTDFEAMLNYMLEQSRAGETAAAAPAPAQQQPRRTEAEPSEQAERQGREPTPSRWGPDTRSVLLTGQSQRNKYDRAREDFRNAYMDRFRAMQQGYGADFGAATAQVWNARKAGATPYQQQIMARRMAIMASGMPTSSYLPGT